MHGFFHLSQTNLPTFYLAKIQSMVFFQQMRANIFFTLVFLLALFISACSTQPTTKKAQVVTKTTIEKTESFETAEEKLALAQRLNAQHSQKAPASLAQQNEISALLIDASELFFQQSNFKKSLWLANSTIELGQNSSQDIYRLLLVKATSLHALNHQQQAYQELQLAKELVLSSNNNNAADALKLTLTYYQTLAQVLTALNKTIPALSAKLNAFALNNNASSDDVLALWHELSVLSQWQVTQLMHSKPPFITGWRQLLTYSHQFGANTEQFSRYLTLWQQQNPTHPAVIIIDQLKSADLTPSRVKNIAVLLPLSGNQKNAGLAAQQGILAAYNNRADNSIHFIDTNTLDWENIAEQFNDLNVDHIVGPLLKPNVEHFLKLSVQQAALQRPTLLLNLSSQQPLASYQTALSMQPEDEATQAAALLSQHNYHKPIILSHQDRVSKRIALAFNQQWQLSTGEPAEIVYFNEGKQMQASLKESLDINASQTRIKQLNGRLKNIIKAEPRNRRDIDMIYLVGTAAQTRLIKPYIDVNISPFADTIPVYASSRSHSNFNDKNNANSINDLQGLTFTQIPWLLDSKQQNKTLTKLSDKLWPKRTDSLSKIFAMGFDSYNLLEKIAQMQQAPYIRHYGQTGVLKLNSANILTRSLIWGQYKQDKVSQVAMD